jgi:hypothetical protein
MHFHCSSNRVLFLCLPSRTPQVTVPPPKNADGTGGSGADVQKTILHSVFGVAAPGQMVALMGMRVPIACISVLF